MNLFNLNSLIGMIVRSNPRTIATDASRSRASLRIFRGVLSGMVSFCVRSVFVPACVLATPFLSAAGSWQWLSPNPTGNHLNSFVYGGGQFVGVGNAGEIITSPDGATWTSRESGITDPLARVVYDGAHFWAISSAALLTSSDGAVWTKKKAPANLLDIAAGNSLLVAIVGPAATGQPYRLSFSPDGSNWTSSDSTVQPLRILFANGVFVAVNSEGHALSSTNGLTWITTQLPDVTSAPFFVAGNGSFLVSSGTKTYLSTDGTTWREVTAHQPDPYGSQQTLTIPYLAGGSVGGSTMGFAGGYFYVQQSRYAQDSYHYYRSHDGETWEDVSFSWRADLSTLASGGGTMVGTELETLYAGVNTDSFAIHSSTDGLTWTTRSSPGLSSDSKLVYGLGRFFIDGKVSSDALSWVSNPFEPTHAAGDLVFRITSQFPNVDIVSTTIDSRAVTSVTVSADGLTGLPVDVKLATPRSVAFGAGRYVFVGDGGNVSSSADGLTWTAGASGTTSDLRAVIFAFDRFIAIGSKGALLTSPDGLTWTVQNTSTTVDFLSVAAKSDSIVVGTPGSATTVSSFTLTGNLPVKVVTTRRSDALLWFDGEFTSVEHYAINYYTGSTSFASSIDGSTWTDLQLHYPASIDDQAMMATGNGIALLAIPAGVSWTLGPTLTAVFQKHNGVAAAPIVTYAPAATTVHQGETATFSAGATGSGPLSYQWNRNSTPIPGATSQVLSLPLVKDGDAGDYTVTVSNSIGSVTSAVAKLTVETPVPLTITKQPVGGTLYESKTFVLSVEVAGSGPVTYQWRRNGTPVWNGTSSSLHIYATSSSLDNYTGTYDVVVTAPYGTATSEAVVVSRGGPSTTVSESGNSTVGGTLVITATTTGKGPFTYEWSRPGDQHWVGANGAVVVLPNLTLTDASPYSVTVTDADGLSTQVFFVVVVSGTDPAPATAQAIATAGQTLTLRAPISVADLSHPSFQWRFKNVPIVGATDWSFTTPPISDATVGDYSVVITNTTGVTTTYTTSVVLGSATTAPTFVAQTNARTVATGATTTFSVSVGGSSVSSYQWQMSSNSSSTWTNITDGAPYSGTTTSVLSITGATAAMNGYQYRCVAGSTAGNTTSNAATLSINNDPALVYPVAIARDHSGNLFVADASANVIRMVTPGGAVSIFAGAVGNAGSADGTGSAARFNQPGGLALDASGTLFVADTGNALIRKITSTGVVTTLAGDATARGNVDGNGSAARFNHPVGLAIDSAGILYVADTFTDTVRKITPGGAVSTLAGTNALTGSADGSGAAARFNNPSGVAVDANGTVFVADTGNNTIRKISADGTVTTLAGLPGVAGSTDGTGSAAFFSQPTNLAIDSNGNLYVADTGNALIRRVTSSGTVALLAGVPGIAGLADGVGLDALFDQPHGLVLDGSGNLLVADTGNAALRKIASDATVTTLALTPASPAPVTSTSTTPTTPTGTSGSSGTSSPASNGGGGSIGAWWGVFLVSLGAARVIFARNSRF
jgi:sugar lactone lactonase YvrE